MYRKPLIISLVLVLVSTLIGCGGSKSKFHSVGLGKYEQAVIQGTPTTQTGSSNFISQGMTTTELALHINKMFNNTAEPGNLVRETRILDDYITDINLKINSQNQSVNPSVQVLPNGSGTVTLPFFGDTVPIDYLVELFIGSEGQCEYAGYKMSLAEQTVVVFNVGPVFEDGTRDYVLFYGKKSGANVVDIWSATLGVDADTGDFVKAWAFKNHIEGTEKFTVTHDSAYYTSSVAGVPKEYFLFRMRENAGALGLLGIVGLYGYDHGANTLLGSKDLPNLGDPVLTTDLTKPVELSDPVWAEMTGFVSTITNPDGTPAPTSIATFNNSFLSDPF